MREVPALRSQILKPLRSQISGAKALSSQIQAPSSPKGLCPEVSKKMPIPRSIHVKNDKFLGGGPVFWARGEGYEQS